MLIKNAHIVNHDKSFISDILVRAGIIESISENISLPGEEIIDAKGYYIFPGGIDVHTHFELPVGSTVSSDDFESGTKAAISGGTTSIIDFTTLAKGESLLTNLDERLKLAEKSFCDYSLHIGVTYYGKNTENEIFECIKRGFTSFKIYMAYKDSIGLNDGDILKVLKAVEKAGGTVLVHCEDGDNIEKLRKEFVSEGKTQPVYHSLSRPPETETDAVKKILSYANEIPVKIYIVHTSAKNSVEEIRTAKKTNNNIFSETCTQYLILNEEKYNLPGFESAKYVMSPPLRSDEHRLALWNAIKDNVISVVSTDHCPFNFKGEKENGINDFTKIPNGAGGVENRLQLLYAYGVLENKISLNKFVEITSYNPAKIFGLLSRKGIIADGSDADIVIWNPEKEITISAKTQLQNCDYNLYEGMRIKGNPEYVIKNGNIVYSNGKYNEEKGNLLKRV